MTDDNRRFCVFNFFESSLNIKGKMRKNARECTEMHVLYKEKNSAAHKEQPQLLLAKEKKSELCLSKK